MLKKECKECHKVFFKIKSRGMKTWERQIFCSVACVNSDRRGKPSCSPSTTFPKGVIPKTAFKVGHVPSKESIKKQVKSRSWYSHQVGTRQKLSDAFKGEKSHFWKGGISPLNISIRASLEYKLWREAVFKRDNYICVDCGKSSSGKLNAHHIKPFALFPELRFAIDNGATLCVPCHKKTDTYGFKTVLKYKKLLTK